MAFTHRTVLLHLPLADVVAAVVAVVAAAAAVVGLIRPSSLSLSVRVGRLWLSALAWLLQTKNCQNLCHMRGEREKLGEISGRTCEKRGCVQGGPKVTPHPI